MAYWLANGLQEFSLLIPQLLVVAPLGFGAASIPPVGPWKISTCPDNIGSDWVQKV